MSPREVFGIIVRTTGLLAILYGVGGMIGVFFPEAPYRSVDYLIGSGPWIVVGVILFFGADSVVSLAYGMRYMHFDDEQPTNDKNRIEET
jgi:hypothetical protein